MSTGDIFLAFELPKNYDFGVLTLVCQRNGIGDGGRFEKLLLELPPINIADFQQLTMFKIVRSARTDARN